MKKLHNLAIVAALLVGGCSTLNNPAAPPQAKEPVRRSITEFGAVADGTTMNTAAIQKAINQVAVDGGGTVVIPQGTFLSGALFLKPGVNLHVDKDGVLKGSTDTRDYPEMMTRIEGHFQPWLPALVNADHIDHLRIDGEGTFDGSGAPYWAAFRAVRGAKNLDVPRPRMLFIRESNNVNVSGLHFLNSGFWNVHLYKCDGVVLDGLDIVAGTGSPSTDGTDVDSSRNVTIQNCHYAVNDDCIALKGTKGPLAMDDKDSPPVEHIRIINCTFERGGSFMTCGSEATIVRDVIVENCKAIQPGRMSVLRLKLRTDTPQLYENIQIRNITLDGGGPIINIAPWSQYFDLQGHPQPSRHIRNVTISNVTGTYGSLAGPGIRGGPGDVIEGITLENIDVKLNQVPGPINNVKDLVIKNVKINGEAYTGQ